MPLKSPAKLSLRLKISALSLMITTLSLAAVAATQIVQIRRQIEADEHRSADSVALGMARAGELAVAVGDKQEVNRLANGFLRDENVLFVAAYAHGDQPIGLAVRDPSALNAYRSGRVDEHRCIVAERDVDGVTQGDEFTSETETDTGPSTRPAQVPGKVGRVVVGISAVPGDIAEQREIRLTIAATLGAALFGGIVLFITLGGWLNRLKRLAEASQSIARGDFTESLVDTHNDEIGRLANSFDEMRETLRERDKKLQRFTETLQEQVHQRTHDLEIALATAEEASRTKSLFLANMSHELRTPLNGVIGMVDLMLAAEPNAQQRRYCDVAKASARALLDLINDILDFSKIEAGKLELDVTTFDLHESIEGVATMFGERAEQKQIELVCGVMPDVPRHVNSDPVRLRQVITNLVSNALKFTARGEVIITVSAQEQSDTHALVRFSVKDSGIGIPADRVNRLFQSFSQVDGSTTRKFGGTGLGLAISRRIVEMLGGNIGVESEEGKGSTFWFTARLEKRTLPDAAPRSDASVDPRGLRVLAVDDNSTNREILRAQLECWHLRADVADGAVKAMAMLKAAHRIGEPYRFAILDMHMPQIDGTTLARQIKADPDLRNVILISLSSIGDRISPQMMEQIGFSACLTKPALPSCLYNSIVDCLAVESSPRRTEVRQPAGPVAALRLDGVHCLLAEDNEINRMVACELLTQAGAICDEVVNGAQAVTASLARDYHVLLMDCQMPELDGFEATRKIREAEQTEGKGRHRAIIALTANAIKGDREQCLAAGMDGYVTKPIDPEELMRTILSFVPETARLGKGAPPVAAPSVAAAPTMAPAPAPAPAVTAPAPPVSPGSGAAQTPGEAPAILSGASEKIPVDVDSLQRRCMGNRKLAAKALSKFESMLGADVSALTEGIKSGDAKAAASAAHKIKGAAGNVSAGEMSRVAGELEQLAKQDRLAQTEEAVAQLQREIGRFRDYLTTALQSLAVPGELPQIGVGNNSIGNGSKHG
jgi:signal transduction histidine kinase/CheY-like chemotaxis protein